MHRNIQGEGEGESEAERPRVGVRGGCASGAPASRVGGGVRWAVGRRGSVGSGTG